MPYIHIRINRFLNTLTKKPRLFCYKASNTPQFKNSENNPTAKKNNENIINISNSQTSRKSKIILNLSYYKFIYAFIQK